MIQTVSFPISNECIQPYGSWDALRQSVNALGLDGIEAIDNPYETVTVFPDDLAAGYHMTFFVDWLDFWRQDESKLLRKFGCWDMIEQIYGGKTPEDLLRRFQKDLAIGQRLKAPYMVFHVSDVSLEEGYIYRWLHTDKEVLDGAIEFINLLFANVEPTFDLLLENQWWPGFKFTEPAMTEYLLSQIEYPRVGIMLDTGHLMNANTTIQNEADGIKWILENIEKHGELSKRIYGLHFHQSVSGDYVRTHTGSLPPEYSSSYYRNFGLSYAHIQKIDQHLPWTDPNCVKILDAVQPKYLTHELSSAPDRPLLNSVKLQLETIQKGYNR